MLQQHFEDFDVVVAQHGVMNCPLSPSGLSIRVDAAFQQPFDALIIVVIGLAQQDRPEALFIELFALHEDLQGRVVVRLRRMIRRLSIVRVRTALEQQAGQLRVMRDSCGTVNRALPLRMRLVILLHPPGIRARARIQERLRRTHESLRSPAIQPEVSRETQMRKRIPAVRASFRCRVPPIEREEPAHTGLIAQNCCCMNVAARNSGMRRQDRLRKLQSSRSVPGVARNTRGLDERRTRIVQ